MRCCEQYDCEQGDEFLWVGERSDDARMHTT